MTNKRVTVFARMKAKDGIEENVRKELMSLVPQTRSEEGCINYDLHQSVDEKTLFMFYENWRSKEDLDKHLEMPYLKSFLEKADKILAEPVDVTLWEKVS
ncbi:antibiotic biosynthesis monooxygenase [bacterium]|nr:antibiotic biosynthesis monooxygenase [bacterium]